MLQIILYIIGLFISFYFLIKAADYLILSASVLGRRAGLSKFIVGLTIVAIGTSLPELFTALIGTLTTQNSAPFVLGTIIGSNIANILLVFGILLYFSKNFKVNIKNTDILMLLIATAIMALLVFLTKITIYTALIALATYGIYLYLGIQSSKKTDLIQEVEEVETNLVSKLSNVLIIGILFVSLLTLNVAAKGVVYTIEALGTILQIPIQYLTLTTVALATSLPEAVVSYSSAKSKEFDLAVGNIIGSNISNVLMICGVIGLIKEVVFDNTVYLGTILIMSLVTLFFILMIRKKHLTKRHAVLMISLYVIYLLWTFI